MPRWSAHRWAGCGGASSLTAAIATFGARTAPVTNAFGALDQFVSFPLQAAQSVDDLKRYHWPAPDWWDFSQIRAVIRELNGATRYHIRYRLGSLFETAWSLYGFERILLDLAAEPAMPRYVMERIAEVHLENLRVVLETAGDLIDIVYFYDDLASQEGLLISPRLYEQHIQPLHQRIIDLARRHGKPVMMHSCGSIYRLIPRLIEMGLAILNPIQPSARFMDPERLAAEFGSRIVFHGGIDVQQFSAASQTGRGARESCLDLRSVGTQWRLHHGGIASHSSRHTHRKRTGCLPVTATL